MRCLSEPIRLLGTGIKATQCSVEDDLDPLYLLYKVERGLGQADRGELISEQEARQRMAKRLK